MHFWPGLCPSPAGGAYSTPPDALAGFSGDLLLREGDGRGGRKGRKGREGREWRGRKEKEREGGRGLKTDLAKGLRGH